ncbi:MAG: energy transducer TonB, partial [Rubricoccaceae bacterium]
MPLRKAPGADLKKSYSLHMQIGFVGALAILLAAFTVPTRGQNTANFAAQEQEIIEVEEIIQTQQIEPPPPPPPAPPPPQEVPDDVIVETVIDEVLLDLTDAPP